MNYLDFDLEITRLAAGRYRAGVRSPAGEAAVEFPQPFPDLELENFILKIGHMRTGKRSIGSPQMMAAQDFGHRLFETVFQGGVRDCFTASLNRLDENTGLRIKLRLTDAPELANLPWEYLYHATQRQFVALSVETPIVRYPNLPRPTRPLMITPPLRLAVMISNPKGNYAELNVESEKAKIASAVRGLEEHGLFKVEWLESASLAELQRRLRQKDPVHIFHFIGHGGWDEAGQDGLLVFKDEFGDGHRVSANNLATILRDHKALRLVVLNACEGARLSPADPFAGVAGALVNSGLPAVLAMQFEITDRAAIQLAKEFYEALADGQPLEGAVAEARKAIFASGNDLEWGTPVLYMRSADGVLFDFAQAKAQAEAEQKAREHAERGAKRVEAERLATGQHVQESKPTPLERSFIEWERRQAEQRAKAEIEMKRLSPLARIENQRESQTEAERLTVKAKAEQQQWVAIPAGEFLYGDDKRKRTLPAFQIMRAPVTQAQYQAFIDTNPNYPVPYHDESWAKPYNWDKVKRRHPANKSNHPVALVSWNDAQAYCKWAGLRLPAEEEWEKVARGTDGRTYPWGEQKPGKPYCNFNGNESGTTPVGKYSPLGDSPYGCVDMAGNVWEWTVSTFDGDRYVLRGGSWGDGDSSVHAMYRNWEEPDFISSLIGFRCARSL